MFMNISLLVYRLSFKTTQISFEDKKGLNYDCKPGRS